MLLSRDDFELTIDSVATDVLRRLTGVVVAVDDSTVTLVHADGSRWACSAGELTVLRAGEEGPGHLRVSVTSRPFLIRAEAEAERQVAA